MTKVNKTKLMDTLYRKAIGYSVEEVVEEYAGEDKGGELIKKKITTKPIPADLTALKTYMDILREDKEYESMSDQELAVERDRVLSKVIQKLPKDNKNVSSARTPIRAYYKRRQGTSSFKTPTRTYPKESQDVSIEKAPITRTYCKEGHGTGTMSSK